MAIHIVRAVTVPKGGLNSLGNMEKLFSSIDPTQLDWPYSVRLTLFSSTDLIQFDWPYSVRLTSGHH